LRDFFEQFAIVHHPRKNGGYKIWKCQKENLINNLHENMFKNKGNPFILLKESPLL